MLYQDFECYINSQVYKYFARGIDLILPTPVHDLQT